MKTKRNTLSLRFPDNPANIVIVNRAIGAFAEQANPTIETVHDIIIAVGEAVSNAITYAYPNSGGGEISVRAVLYDDNTLTITVRDNGIGIDNVEKAREPLVSINGLHAGLGFTVMESFMDSVSVRSNSGCSSGTTVVLKKKLDIKGI